MWCLVCVAATQMEGEFLPSKLPADDSQHFNVGGCELLCLVSVGISAEQTRASNEGYPKVCEDFIIQRPLLGHSRG